MIHAGFTILVTLASTPCTSQDVCYTLAVPVDARHIHPLQIRTRTEQTEVHPSSLKSKIFSNSDSKAVTNLSTY